MRIMVNWLPENQAEQFARLQRLPHGGRSDGILLYEALKRKEGLINM